MALRGVARAGIASAYLGSTGAVDRAGVGAQRLEQPGQKLGKMLFAHALDHGTKGLCRDTTHFRQRVNQRILEPRSDLTTGTVSRGRSTNEWRLYFTFGR